jgi:hypothetical protein
MFAYRMGICQSRRVATRWWATGLPCPPNSWPRLGRKPSVDTSAPQSQGRAIFTQIPLADKSWPALHQAGKNSGGSNLIPCHPHSEMQPIEPQDRVGLRYKYHKHGQACDLDPWVFFMPDTCEACWWYFRYVSCWWCQVCAAGTSMQVFDLCSMFVIL